MINLDSLENKIGFKFNDINLLKEAMTHRSYINENPSWKLPHNERLEFLGDAVLELAVTENLFQRFPEEPEGQLTSIRAALVNYQMLAQVARSVDLEDYLLLSRGEKKTSVAPAKSFWPMPWRRLSAPLIWIKIIRKRKK